MCVGSKTTEYKKKPKKPKHCHSYFIKATKSQLLIFAFLNLQSSTVARAVTIDSKVEHFFECKVKSSYLNCYDLFRM